MANWYRQISNVLLAAAVICAGLGIVMATGWLERDRLTAERAVLDLGEVTPGDTVPVRFTLRNHSRKPIRLVGANEP